MKGLTLAQIQYLRGLVISDQLEKDYKNNPEAKIARNQTMYAFTESILKRLDEMEFENGGEK